MESRSRKKEIVFGRHAVFHLLKARRRTTHLIYLLKGSDLIEDPILELARGQGVKVEVKERSFFSQFEGGHHQGVVAEAEPFPYSSVEELGKCPTLLLLEGFQDPQNLGALCRTAYLLGVRGIVVTEHHSVLITPGVCKAAAGAVEYLSITRVSSMANCLNLLKDKGFWIYGLDASGDRSLSMEEFPEKVAIVVGGEGEGVSRLVRERCDILVRIPMEGGEIGSFNAGVAGALALYEIFRQRHLKSRGSS